MTSDGTPARSIALRSTGSGAFIFHRSAEGETASLSYACALEEVVAVLDKPSIPTLVALRSASTSFAEIVVVVPRFLLR